MENNQKGKPVIVFENGRGTDFEYWLSIIIKEVSKGNVTFAYNRPRIGSSEDDNQLPTIDHITEILRQSLLAKGLYPPYILVGHSWGAACISNRNSLPDVPVHFIMAGGYPLNPEATSALYDQKKMFRINNTIKIKSWLELINPLKYGKFFYCSNSGHIVQKDDPDIIISSIKLVLNDYGKMMKEKETNFNN